MLLDISGDADEIVIFYTKNSPHMAYSSVIKLLQNSSRTIKFEECYEGNNALDFQLISYLGYLMAGENPANAEFVIMSNDTGYDPAIRFWKKKGFSIKRFNINYCKMAVQRQKQVSAEPLDKAEPTEEAAGTAEEAAGTAEEALAETPELAENVAEEKATAVEGTIPAEKATLAEDAETEHGTLAEATATAEHGTLAETAAAAEHGTLTEATAAATSAATGKNISGSAETETVSKPDAKSKIVAVTKAEPAAGTGAEGASNAAAGKDSEPAYPVAILTPPAGKAPIAVAKPPASKNPVAAAKAPAGKDPVAAAKASAGKDPVAVAKAPAGKDPVAAAKAPAGKASPEAETSAPSKPYDFNKEEVDSFLNCLGKDNLVLLHETFVHVYGMEQGQAIYKTIKEKTYTYKREENLSRKDKVMRFTDMIFARSNLDAPGNFVDFLEKNKDRTRNLNSIRSAITKTFGNGNGMKYYSLFKPYFKIISALK